MTRFRYSSISLFALAFVAALLSLALRNWSSIAGKSLFIVVAAATVAYFPASWAARKSYPGISRILIAGASAGFFAGIIVVLSAFSVNALGGANMLYHIDALFDGACAGLLGGFSGMAVGLLTAYLAFQRDDLNS